MTRKRILMTGASSGIGAAAATLFNAAGDEVVSIDIKPAATDVAAHYTCDLSNPAAIDATVAELDGHFDALLNIAGVPGTLPADVIMRVNTLGLKHLTTAVFDRLNRGGAIVNIASIAGFNWARHLKDINELLAIDDFESAAAWCAARDMDGDTAYHFSKECVVVYTKQLAGPALKRGLRANAISPGPVATPLLPDFRQQTTAGQIDWLIESIGGAAEPLDIANVVQYLATGASQFINGQDITVDRGFSAGLTTGWIDKDASPLIKARQVKAS